MWFKNLRVYRLPAKPVTDQILSNLDEMLAQQKFEECGKMDIQKSGFVSPLGAHGSTLTHEAMGKVMVCLKSQEKILPASAINEQVEKKIQQIRDEENRSVSRKEKIDIKDEIIFSLLPNALTKSRLTFAYFDLLNSILVVNESSAKKAEALLSALRDALGSLPVIPLQTEGMPCGVMTGWISEGETPKSFDFGGSCKLIDRKDGATVTVKDCDLTSHEVIEHVNTGMLVDKLALSFEQSISFTVDSDLSFTRVKFCEELIEKADEREAESYAEQFDADFQIMSIEIGKLIPAVLEAFGGERKNPFGEQ